MLAKSEVIALLVMCLYGDNQVSHVLTITHLPENQRKELVPVCEVLHIADTSILVDDVTELVQVYKSDQLGETYFGLFICSHLF